MKEYELTVDVTLVLSTQSITEQMMKVSQWWFNAMKKHSEPGPLIGALYMDEQDVDQIMPIHRSSENPRVWQTTYFVKRVCPLITKIAVKSAKNASS